MLITFEGFAAEAVDGARRAGNVPTYVVNLPGNDQRPAGTRHYDELYFADDAGEIEPVNADDTAVIIYTSGTTGKPKGGAVRGPVDTADLGRHVASGSQAGRGTRPTAVSYRLPR
jgi:acyl-CoA synthetase (AMP-forming)/AMP-acid ligase II